MHEIVQVAVRLDDLGAGAQPQMKGIAEQNLCPDAAHFFRGHGFYRAIGADRHEGRRLHATTIKFKLPASRHTIVGNLGKTHTHRRTPGCGQTSIASP